MTGNAKIHVGLDILILRGKVCVICTSS